MSKKLVHLVIIILSVFNFALLSKVINIGWNQVLIQILAIAFLTVTFGCQKSADTGEISVTMPPINTLVKTGSFSSGKDVSFYNPVNLYNINDEHLLLLDYVPSDILKVYDLETLSYKYSYGEKGRGPDEFMFIPFYFFVNGNELQFYNPFKQGMDVYSVTDSAITLSHSFRLGYAIQNQPLNEITRLNDSLYFAMYDGDPTKKESTNREFVALKPNYNDTLFTFGFYPNSDLDEMSQGFEFYKSLVSKSDGSKVVSFYHSYNSLKIFDSKGNLTKIVSIKDEYLGELKEGRENEQLFRMVRTSSDNFIYLVGFRSVKDDANLEEGIFEIWNWEGEPLYRGAFDRKITQFTISEKFNTIYAIDSTVEDSIYTYQLPSF